MNEPTFDDLNALTDIALDAANPATQAVVSPLGIWLSLAHLEHHLSAATPPELFELTPDAHLACSIWSSLIETAGMFALPSGRSGATEQVERWLAVASSGQLNSLVTPLPNPTHLLLATAGMLVLTGAPAHALPVELSEFATGEYQLSATPGLDSVGLVEYAGTTVAWGRLEGTSTVSYLTSAPDSALTGIDLARCAARLATGGLEPRPAQTLPDGAWPGLVVREQLLDSPVPRCFITVKSFDVSTELSLFDLATARAQLDAWALSSFTSVSALHAVTLIRAQLSATPPNSQSILQPSHDSRAACFYGTSTLGYATLPRYGTELPLLFCGWANNPAGDPALLNDPFDEFDFTALDLDLSEAAGLYVPDALTEINSRVLVDARTRSLPGNLVPRDPRRVVRK